MPFGNVENTGMELRHLRYFVAVAETLHFSRAAERLRLTQPALSRQIRDLEDELGARLLHRHGTETALTAAGRSLLEDAREILAAAERAAERVRAGRDRIRLGHYGGLWLDRYAPALRAFAREFPSARLDPVEIVPADMPASLRRGDIDLALIGPAPGRLGPGLRVLALETVEARLAFRASHPLAKRRVHALSDLRDCRWVGWKETDFPGRNDGLREAAAAAYFSPRFTHFADSAASLLTRVASTDEIGCVLPFTRRLPHSGVVFSHLRAPGVRYRMDVVWNTSGDQPERLARLAALLAGMKPAG